MTNSTQREETVLEAVNKISASAFAHICCINNLLINKIGLQHYKNIHKKNYLLANTSFTEGMQRVMT